jgi:CheY-like chemotaxis protein
MQSIQCRILIIGSDVPNIRLLSDILKCNGYEPLEARSVIEGINLAADGNPRLILLDSEMPGWLEISKNIRPNMALQDIPTIILSPYATKRDREKFVRLGFLDCIGKPFNLREFVRIIDRHLKTKRVPGK